MFPRPHRESPVSRARQDLRAKRDSRVRRASEDHRAKPERKDHRARPDSQESQDRPALPVHLARRWVFAGDSPKITYMREKKKTQTKGADKDAHTHNNNEILGRKMSPGLMHYLYLLDKHGDDLSDAQWFAVILPGRVVLFCSVDFPIYLMSLCWVRVSGFPQYLSFIYALRLSDSRFST